MRFAVLRGRRPRALIAGALCLMACENLTEPSAAGYKVVATAPGNRFSAVILHGDTAFSARDDGMFTATSITSGREFWSARITTANWPVEHMSDGPGLIYIGLGTGVVAISRASGAVAWRFADPTLEIVATSYITNNGKYVAFAQRRGVVTVLDALTGNRVWQRSILPDNDLNAVSAPVFCDSTLVYSRLRPTGIPVEGDVIAFGLRASNGDTLWTLRVNSTQGLNDYGGISSAASADGVFLATYDGQVVKLRANDGSIVWRTHIPSQGYGDFLTVSISGSEVIVGSPAKPGVESLDIATGRSNWSVTTAVGSPVFALGVGAKMIAFAALGAQLVFVDRTSHASRFIGAGELKVGRQAVDFTGVPEFAGDLTVVSTSAGLLTLRPK